MKTFVIVASLLHLADYVPSVPMVMDNESQAAYLNTCVHGLTDRIPTVNKVKVCECTLARFQTMTAEDAMNSIQAVAMNCARSVGKASHR